MTVAPDLARTDGPWAVAASTSVVRAALAENRLIRVLQHVPEVGSTQDELRALAVAGADAGTVLVTDRQRAGRGRSGNRWDDDPAGGSLAMSVLLDTATGPLEPRSVPLVPHALGVAVVGAIAALGTDAGAGPLRLKWPNDVVHRATPTAPARKLAGVLVERERIAGEGRDVLLCGIGLNVALTGDVPPDRIDLATVLGRRPDPAMLLAALLQVLDLTLRGLATPVTVMDRARALSDTVGRRVSVRVPGEEPFVGFASGIDAEGRLLVTTGGRVRAILSGTVRDADGVGGTGDDGGTVG